MHGLLCFLIFSLQSTLLCSSFSLSPCIVSHNTCPLACMFGAYFLFSVHDTIYIHLHACLGSLSVCGLTPHIPLACMFSVYFLFPLRACMLFFLSYIHDGTCSHSSLFFFFLLILSFIYFPSYLSF